MDEDNITLYEKPVLTMAFKIYDMNSLLVKQEINYRIEDDIIKQVLKGEKE
jgi:hypothetical protein